MKNNIENAVTHLKKGGMVVLMDEDSREGEADVVIPAEKCTIEDLRFMATKCMGVICLAANPNILDRLQIPLMVKKNTDRFSTGFTVSVDYKHGTTTGVSLYDRLKTIRAILDKKSRPTDFTRPGHVFPLRSNPKGLRGRKGHTESSIHLMKMAKLSKAAVICEVLNKKGKSADKRESKLFAETHGLQFLKIRDLL